MNKDNEVFLAKIGATFGDAIAQLVGNARAFAVTILDVDDEFAYVTMTGNEKQPMTVPLTGMMITNTMLRVKPNIGSLSIVAFSDGEETSAYFVAHSQIDEFMFTRGTTEFKWSITPTGRDAEGNEIDGDTADEISLSVGETSVKVDTDVWEFNGGSLGGLVMVEEILTKLNNLENAFNAHVHPTAAVGVPSPPTPVPNQIPLIPTQKIEIENTKITQ